MTEEYTKIPKLDRLVCRVGFGCGPLGMYEHGYTDDRELIRAVRVACDLGINLFDTADTYGLGTSEKLLGRALGKHRHKVVIVSKFGVRRKDNQTYYDNSLEWLQTALAASLKRLQTNYIDIYQVHYWDGKTPLDDVFANLERLRERGDILSYGTTNIRMPHPACKRTGQGFNSFGFEYSLAERSRERDILGMVDSLRAVFIGYGSLGQGILTGKYGLECNFGDDDRRRRKAYVNFHGDRLARNVKIVAMMREIQKNKPDASLSQIAIAYNLHKIKNCVALTGVKNSRQAEELRGATRVELTENELKQLDQASSGRN